MCIPGGSQEALPQRRTSPRLKRLQEPRGGGGQGEGQGGGEHRQDAPRAPLDAEALLECAQGGMEDRELLEAAAALVGRLVPGALEKHGGGGGGGGEGKEEQELLPRDVLAEAAGIQAPNDVHKMLNKLPEDAEPRRARFAEILADLR